MKVKVWVATASVLLAIVGQSAPAADAATVLTLEPLDVGQGPMMTTELQSSLCKAPNTCKSVPYAAVIGMNSVSDGVAALDRSIGHSPGQTVVFGYSLGAEVAQVWLADHGDDAGHPHRQDLTFVLIGNPYRKYGGLFVPAARLFGVLPADPDTDPAYQVVDVARQYDGFADFPDKVASPGYALAVANAAVGMFLVHSFYQDVNPDDPANVRWTEGNTTYVLVPTATLPLVEPLRRIGLTGLADSLNTTLKPIVDSAYSRPSPNSVIDSTDPLESADSVELERVSTNAGGTSQSALGPAATARKRIAVGNPDSTAGAVRDTLAESAQALKGLRKSIVSATKENLARFAPKPKQVTSGSAQRTPLKSGSTEKAGRPQVARALDRLRRAEKATPAGAGASTSRASDSERKSSTPDV